MVNRRDHRDQRRRGFGGDEASFPGESEEPKYFQRQPVSTGSAVDAEVLWFNADKGFGFVKLADGSEAFLHIRALEAAGHGGVSEGARLRVTVETAQKGKQVTQVLDVTGGSSPRPSSPQRTARPAPGGSFSGAPEQEREGTVKWYNADKGFGFISLDGGEKDVFVHATALTRAGLTTLAEGQRVVVGVSQSAKGLEARSVRLA
ncbi:MAG TPA: cold-shock protein [Mesorhizobium sp.]|jgi:CspA family cold shock protein|nr:cold-shock protein [Mesorhizobium sp.]